MPWRVYDFPAAHPSRLSPFFPLAANTGEGRFPDRFSAALTTLAVFRLLASQLNHQGGTESWRLLLQRIPASSAIA